MTKSRWRYPIRALPMVAALALMHTVMYAQDSSSSFARHSIFVEGAGAAGSVSLNYDFLVGESASLRIRSGYVLPHLIDRSGYQTIHVAFSARTNADGSAFEGGLGVSSTLGETEPRMFFGGNLVLILGYRYQPRSGGVMFRISTTTFLMPRFNGHPAGLPFWPWGGVSLGYAF